MTLKELITTNGQIGKMDIQVRDYEQSNGHLIQEYHIGPYEDEDRFADPKNHIEPRWITIKKPINYIDIGKDYEAVFLKNIPKQLLDLEVKNWKLWHGWTTNNGLLKHYWLVADVAGKDKAILIEDNNSIEQCEQLPGQINLLDII